MQCFIHFSSLDVYACWSLSICWKFSSIAADKFSAFLPFMNFSYLFISFVILLFCLICRIKILQTLPLLFLNKYNLSFSTPFVLLFLINIWYYFILLIRSIIRYLISIWINSSYYLSYFFDNNYSLISSNISSNLSNSSCE